MRRIFSYTALALALSGGVALADPNRPRTSEHRRSVAGHGDVGAQHRGYTTATPAYGHGSIGASGASRNHGTVAVSRSHSNLGRPIIRDHIDHQRAATVVDHHRATSVWIPAAWQWDGHSWIWIEGRYESGSVRTPY